MPRVSKRGTLRKSRNSILFRERKLSLLLKSTTTTTTSQQHHSQRQPDTSCQSSVSIELDLCPKLSLFYLRNNKLTSQSSSSYSHVHQRQVWQEERPLCHLRCRCARVHHPPPQKSTLNNHNQHSLVHNMYALYVYAGPDGNVDGTI